MKKPLFVLAFAVAASPALDAKVYSCGDGCYTSNPKASKGRANLGKQIGSYTGYRPQTEVAIADKIAEPAVVAKPKTQTVAVHRPAAPSVPRPMPVALRQTPATTMAAPEAVTAVRRASGRRTILEQELNNERTALANAQKALADGRVVVGTVADANHQSKIRKLESAVLDRQQNIQALQRELSRM